MSDFEAAYRRILEGPRQYKRSKAERDYHRHYAMRGGRCKECKGPCYRASTRCLKCHRAARKGKA